LLLSKFRESILVVIVLFLSAPGALAQSSSVPPELIAKVLDKADSAYVAQRYTLPKYNNAYDRYRAVLTIDPDNARAKEGLQKILQTYLALVQGELEGGSLQYARDFLATIDEYFPGTAQTIALRSRLAAAMQKRGAAKVNDLTIKAFDLDSTALVGRTKEVKDFLVQLARRVADSRETVLILARSDAEGRWIYQVMNEATPSYRVRGDIQLAIRPAIRLLEPL
jgi:hypothetical protein